MDTLRRHSDLDSKATCDDRYSKYEHEPQKLLLNSQKCQNIIQIIDGDKNFDDSLPISIELHLTNRCNLNCEWCIDRNVRKGRESLPMSSLIRLLDDLQGRNIGLTIEGGGEPTLYEHFSDFVNAVHERGIDIGLITNGTNKLPSSIIPYFKWIRVSVDASTQEEYLIEKRSNQFDKVMNNIAHICEHKDNALVGVGYVLNNRNHSNIVQFMETLQDFGVDFLQVRGIEEALHLSIPASQLDARVNDIQDSFTPKTLNVRVNAASNYLPDNAGLPCVAHSLRSIIHADGEVILCEKRRHDIIGIGNINQDSFPDIWNAHKRKKATAKLLVPENQIGCSECRIVKYNQLFNDLCKIRTGNFI